MKNNNYREMIIALVQKITNEDILKKIYAVARKYYELLEEKADQHD